MAKKTTFKLERNIPFLLHRLASRLSSVANEKYKTQGINTQVARVLMVLWTNEEATVGELCEATTIDQSTLSHMLNRLRAKGIITKKREDKDNRTVRVSLTPEGAELAGSCVEVASKYEQKAVAGLSSQEVAILQHALLTIYKNFEDEA